jgi:hypothetical protein
MTTVDAGRLHRRDSHPLEQQLASLHPRFLGNPCAHAPLSDPGEIAGPGQFGSCPTLGTAILPSAVSTASALTTHSFRGSITRPARSLSTLRGHGHPCAALRPRKTRFRLVAYLGRTGLVAARSPEQGPIVRFQLYALHVILLTQAWPGAPKHESDYRFRTLDTSRLDEDFRIVARLTIEGFRGHTGYVPLPLEEFTFYIGDVRGFLDPSMVQLAETPDGTPCGLFYAYPNWWPLVRALGTDASLERMLALRSSYPPRDMVLHTAVIAEGHRRQGLIDALYARAIASGQKAGLTHAMTGFTKIGIGGEAREGIQLYRSTREGVRGVPQGAVTAP